MKLLQRVWGQPVLMLSLLGVGLLFYHPFAGSGGSHLPGQLNNKSDATYNWNFYHLQAWSQGEDELLHTHLQYLPSGNSLLLNTNGWTASALVIFTQDVPTAVWASFWLHLLLAGVGVYLLAGLFLRHRAYRIVASLVFCAQPSLFAFLLHGHFNLSLVGFVPWCLYALVRWQRQPRVWKWSVLAGVFGLLVALSEPMYAYMLALVMGMALLWWVTERWLFPLSRWKKWLWVVGVLLFAHYLHDTLLSLKLDDNGARYFQNDLANFVLPSEHSYFYQYRWVDDAYSQIFSENRLKSGNTYFLGFSQLLLFGFLLVLAVRKGVFREDKRFRFLLFMALCVLLASLVELRMFGWRTIKPPFALLHFLPLISEHRVAIRIGLFLVLLFPLLIGYLLERGLLRRPVVLTVSVLWPLLVLAEFYPVQLPTIHKDTVPVQPYKELAQLPAGSLLTFPLCAKDGKIEKGSRFDEVIYYQYLHHKPLFAGHLSRMDATAVKQAEEHPGLASLLKASEKGMLPTDTASLKQQLYKLGSRYILIKPAYLNTPAGQWLHEIFSRRAVKRITIEGFVLIILY